MDTLSDPNSVLSLEQRVVALEQAVKRLLEAQQSRLATPAASAAPPVLASRPPALPPTGYAPPRPAVAAPVRQPFELHLAPKSEPTIDLEQWLGARGLLLIGVVALLAATGFFLKYAFDRGWVAPGVRVLGAVVAGLAVAAYGEERVRSGMRRFGLALVGAGGGLIYLGIWAAAGPYALIGRPAGIAVITVAATAAAVRAVHHDAEGLALWALLGAFMAPLILRSPTPNLELFLSYVAVVGFATAAVSKEMEWRIAMSAGLFGSLLLALLLVSRILDGSLGFGYLAACGIAALYLAPRSWIEHRVLLFVTVWIALITYAGEAQRGAGLYAVTGAVLLLLAAWWQYRRVAALQARRLSGSSPAEDLIGLVFAPIACAIVATRAGGPFLNAHPEVSLGVVALLYLATGWRGRWAAFVGVGWALAALALTYAFSGSERFWAWSVAIAAGAAADAWQDQEATTPVTVALIAFGGLGVLINLLINGSDETAFTGEWALAIYVYLAAVAGAASWWRVGSDRPSWAGQARGLAWTAVGTVVFFGMSIELPRLVRQVDLGTLAAGLATSVWWLLYAGLLVRLGFAKSSREIRWAGLGVACAAAAKIALVDLSELEALYRVAAFFVLALLALAVAYAYNRRMREAAGTGTPAG